MRACFALVVGMSLRSSLADPEPVRFNLITYAGTPPSYHPYLVLYASAVSPMRAVLRPQPSITLHPDPDLSLALTLTSSLTTGPHQARGCRPAPPTSEA